MGRVAGKTALVAGAGTGMGRATALRLAEEGAQVIAVARTKAKVDEVAQLGGGRITAFACDIGEQEQVEDLASVCAQRWGHIDILVNSAGISASSVGNLYRVHEMPVDAWDKVMNTNIRGAFLLMRAAIPLMLERGGSIINVSSIGAVLAPANGRAAYGASKSGMVQLSRCAATEYGPDKIRVNAILPGFIQTPMLEGAPQEQILKLSAEAPIGRIGTAEEVASLILFLASDESAFITGAAYLIDGGRTLK